MDAYKRMIVSDNLSKDNLQFDPYHTLRIDHQLVKRGSTGYYIEETKTTAGRRVIPMTPDVEACFRRIILKRNPPRNEPKVQGRPGFLFFDKNGSIVYSLHWEHYFKHMVQK